MRLSGLFSDVASVTKMSFVAGVVSCAKAGAGTISPNAENAESTWSPWCLEFIPLGAPATLQKYKLKSADAAARNLGIAEDALVALTG